MRKKGLETTRKPEHTGAGTIAAFEVRRAVSTLLCASDCARAIMSCCLRGSTAAASSFDRYAARILSNAGAEGFSKVAKSHTLKLLPPENGHLVRIVSAQTLDNDEQRVVESVENAVNRLVCILDAMEDGIYDDASTSQGARVGISFMGSGFLPQREGFRSAQIRLPAIEPGAVIGEAFYNEIDWRVLDGIADNSRAVFQSSLLLNPSLCVLGASALEKSDWDVRTRLAHILSRLELPLRCWFDFDCDTEVGTVSIGFTCPSAADLPSLPEHGDAPEEYSGNQGIAAARTVLCIRLACLIAAAGFGSSRAIERVFVKAADPDGGVLLCSLFERDDFVRTAMAAIDEGRFSDSVLRTNPAGISALTGASILKLADSDAWEGSGPYLPKEEIPNDGMDRQRQEVYADTRMLPQDMQKMFHVQRVCDIDTQHQDEAAAALLDEAVADSREYMLAAIARLESIVASEEEKLAQHPAERGEMRPLYAPHPLARLAVALIGEELEVGMQAQEYLRQKAVGEGHDAVIDDPEPILFKRAPESLYWALMGLSGLYQRMGDIEGANQLASRCIDLAPTASRPYLRKAEVLDAAGKRNQAINTLMDGLRCAVTVGDSSFLYYHLGLLLAGAGHVNEAAAVHVYNAAFMGVYCDKSRNVVEEMQVRGTIPLAFETSAAALRHLKRFGIPVAPVEMGALIAKATIGLSCAHAPEAAAPYARMLEHLCPNDPIVIAACRSIRYGVR